MAMSNCLSVVIRGVRASSYVFRCTQRVLLEPSSRRRLYVCGLRTCLLWTLIRRHVTNYCQGQALIVSTYRGEAFKLSKKIVVGLQ